MDQPYDIFLSYRRDGGMETAMLLHSALEKRGYRVFLDVESLRSGPFNTELYQFIDNCKDFVLVLPPNGLDRCADENDWVRLEIERAHESGKNIIPILLKNFEFPPVLPASIDFIRFQNGLRAALDYFDAFVSKLEMFLKSSPAAPSAPPRAVGGKKWLLPALGALALTAVLVLALALRSSPAAPAAVTASPAPTQAPAAAAQVPAAPTEAPTAAPTEAPTQAPAADPGEAARWEDNVLMADICWGSKEEAPNALLFRSQIRRSQIISIRFLDSLETMPEDAWDVSETLNDRVMAWVTPFPGDMYKLYIAAEGGICAPEYCSGLFNGYTGLESIQFNGALHTENTVGMRGMFRCCSALRELDLGSFDTARVSDMSCMFDGCTDLGELDVSGFDTGNVTNMRGMFYWCYCLTALDVSGFDTRNVTDMSYMFDGCVGLSELDLSGFDTRNVTAYENFLPDSLDPDWRELFA